jgi:hypothetical protein
VDSGAHKSLRQEWIETPPDVSYRFVVSLDTARAGDSVVRTLLQQKQSWWQRAVALFMRDLLRLVMGALLVALLGWFSFHLALVVDHALDATRRLQSVAFLPILTLLMFLSLLAVVHIVARRLARSAFQRFYRDFYFDNEFLLEGRESYLWFEEQSAGAIRRWSTFEQLVEFDEGMWLFLRRRTTYAGYRGILISKESLPGSCPWDELKEYLRQRIEQGADCRQNS